MGDDGENEEDVSAFDAATYAHQMTEQLANVAADAGLARLAQALMLAHALAADALDILRNT